MNYAEMLKKFRDQRNEKIAAMQAMHEKASQESRTFTAEEKTSFEGFAAQVKSLDDQIASTETMERLAGGGNLAAVTDNAAAGGAAAGSAGSAAAGGAASSGGAAGGSGVVAVRDNANIAVVRNLPKGTSFTRYAMALAQSKGNLMQAVEAAKQWEGSTPEVSRVLRAAVAAGTTTDPAWAAPLIDYRTMAEEFIDLLRPATILGRLNGVRRVPFNVRIPRQTAGATVGWVGEGAPKPVSRLSFDTITMPFSKIAGIVVITTELARFSSPAAEAVVRQDMIEAMSEFSDAQFINPGIAPVANVSPGSITNGAQAVASAGTTLADIEEDLRAARTYFVANRIPLTGAVWIVDPTTRISLEELRTAQDVAMYPTLAANGTLKGLQVIDSLGMGTYDQDGAGAGVAGKYLALVSAPNVMVADDGQVMLDASSEASLVMDDAPGGAGAALTSLWQRNMIGIRAERMIHWMRRRNAGVFVVFNVGY